MEENVRASSQLRELHFARADRYHSFTLDAACLTEPGRSLSRAAVKTREVYQVISDLANLEVTTINSGSAEQNRGSVRRDAAEN